MLKVLTSLTQGLQNQAKERSEEANWADGGIHGTV